MIRIYNFYNCELGAKSYDGAEPKTCIIIDGNYFILKEPRVAKTNIPLNRREQQAEYYYNCISEFLGSHIFALCGFNTQETHLGYYDCIDGKRRLCVACKDFTEEEDNKVYGKDGKVGIDILLTSMSEYRKDFIRQRSLQIGTRDGDAYLDEMDNIWKESNYLKDYYEDIKKEYYDRFVIDALIGNPDRHNGNWGFLTPNNGFACLNKPLTISPVYDCGASFLSQASEDRIAFILKNEEILKERLTNFPKSQVSEFYPNKDGIKYYEYFNSLKNEDLNQSIIRIKPRIEKALPKIKELIDDMVNANVISSTRGQFYKTFVEGRYKNIIEEPYNALKKIEKQGKEEDDEMVL